MGSSRLPGKVLADIGGRPALAHVLARAARIERVDQVVLAIPREAGDDALADVGVRAGAAVVRGERDDVLDRFYTAAVASHAAAVVRITADCPLLDPAVSSLVVRRFLDGDVEYVSNVQPPTYPDGYDTEVVSMRALAEAWREARDPFEREHVTPFVRNRPERFRFANVSDAVDRSAWRLTLDTEEDLLRIRAVWDRAGADDAFFGLNRVIAIAEREPHLVQPQS
jgi:spore coat polysaccharide biosynthesis protein SpsF (cytidylyltransferase family)